MREILFRGKRIDNGELLEVGEHNPKNVFTLRKIKEQRKCFNCFDNEKCTLEQPCCKGSKPSMFD